MTTPTVQIENIPDLERLLAIWLEGCAINAEVAGMVAENKQREALGQSMAYTESDFLKAMSGLINLKDSIGHQ